MRLIDDILGKKGLITFTIIFIIILILGIFLFYQGYNESFYSESKPVRDVFTIITNLGEPMVFILLIGIFYIVYDKRFAKNLALNLMVSTYVNSFLKDIFRDLRPPQAEGKTSYGFPSGHNQTAVSAWGYIGYHFRDKILVVIIMAVIIFLVGISRLIIGVHDVQDVFGGILIGLALLMSFILIEPLASKKFNKLDIGIQMFLVVYISVVLFVIGTLLFPTTELGLTPNPPSYSDAGNYALVGGVLLGFGIGYLLENKYVGYDPKILNNQQRIINLVVGIVIAFVIFLGLESIRDIFDSVIFRYFRYALVSFILAFLVPIVLIKIGNANVKN
jgi:membrane-associated phospholipid phosphatase